MKNEKKKLLKIILIILFSIVFIYVIFVLNRFCIINKINKNYKEETNYCIVQESDDIVKTFWRKDNIYKVRIATPKLNNENFSGNVFWYDDTTKENYRYIESEKKYQEDNNAKNEVMPDYDLIMPVKTESLRDTLLYSMNIFNTIKTDDLNGKQCYIFKDKTGNEKYIDKETGLCIFETNKIVNKYNVNGELKEEEVTTNLHIKYSFDTVKGEEVRKPDFSEYQITEF